MEENYEGFNEDQIRLLSQYVTNTTGNIFVLQNLPEVIKGALFSRYSRSPLGLRSLLLKEFINSKDSEFDAITAAQEQIPAQQADGIKRATNFYDRILDGYGDDSIAELGGSHLALENISFLAAKEIEDCRIGGSPLEKSTRYIYFDQKYKGEYAYYRDPVIMTSSFRDTYLRICNHLFETYSQLIPPLTQMMQDKYPREEEVSVGAYNAAIRAKVLDCLRGLLPAATLTNMGLYGNGRFFEHLVRRLNRSNFVEYQEIAKQSLEELSKVIPSFIKRANPSHPHAQAYQVFYEKASSDLKAFAAELAQEWETGKIEGATKPEVKLCDHDPKGLHKMAALLLYPHTNESLDQLEARCANFGEKTLAKLFDVVTEHRENRRHKSPRALERVSFTFEIVADFGIYRDLQRHRLLTQDRQLLTCNLGYYIPPEIIGTALEVPYREAMEQAKVAYEKIAKEFPEEAQYVVPIAYRLRWYFHINLRALQWLTELRSSPAGHPTYRYVAQEMASQVCHTYPLLGRFFRFVDYEGHPLGRLSQEIRQEERSQNSN
jgi:thymidylate synthase ThyX